MQPTNTIDGVWRQGVAPRVVNLTGTAFMEEAGAHVFRVTALDEEGEQTAITGTVSALFLRADNTTVALDGTIADGVAQVTLVADCYHAPGRFSIAVYVSDGTDSACIYAAVGNVYRTSSDTVIDSGATIPTLAQLQAAYADCVAATEAAENCVSYEAQTPTAAQQAQARTNTGAAAQDSLSALDSRVNAVHCMVDYWGADFINSAGSVTRYSTRMSINAGFAASTGVNQSKGYRLNGTCIYFANRNALDALTNGIKLKDGHTYRWYYCDEHGTQTRAGGGRGIFARAYAYGGHSSLGTTGYYGVTEYREFKYTDATYPNGVQLCALIYTDAVITFTDWSANFILEDVTYGHITDKNIAPVEAGDTARANHTSGSLLLWNGNLYKATEAIETGGTVAGKVSSATTVAAQLAALEARIAALEAAAE